MQDPGDATDDEPRRLGRFEVLFPLGPSARESRVYLASGGPSPGAANADAAYVAIRLLPPAERSLLREVKKNLRVCHTNLVQLIEADEWERGVFVVEDYIPGATLEALLAADLPRAMALRILTDALFGLHVLHERKDTSPPPSGGRSPIPSELRFVHRALCPATFVAGTDGIARATPLALPSESAAHFRAPEDTDPARAVDRRADVWSAAAIAWEIVTGGTLPDRVAGEAPPRARSVIATVSEDVDDVLERALRVDPEARIADARQLATELSGAARDAGLLADLDAIASHVKSHMRPELGRRKARIADARRARELRRPSAPDVRTMIGIGAPALKKGPLPDLPELPIVHDDGASELRIEVALPQTRTLDRASADVLGETRAPPEPEDEAAGILQSPVVVPDAATAASGRAPGYGPRAREPGGILDRLRPWFRPPWTTTKVSVLVGIGGGLLGFLVVLLAIPGRPKVPPSALVAPTSSSAAAPSPDPGDSAGAGTTPTTVASGEAEETAAVLHLKANGPIASVRVGSRNVDTVVPAPTVSVDLIEDEKDSPLHVVVTASDGRIATLNTNAGELEIDVVFAEKPAAPRPHPSGTSTVKHPWSKRPR
jgi:hypothetical protein